MARYPSIVIAAAMVASATTAAYAGGTEAQREACTPDAFRLCTSAMPDEGRVESCLRAAGPRLSAPCHAVFYPEALNSQAQMTRGQAPMRGRLPAQAPQRAAPAQAPDTSAPTAVIESDD